MHQMVDVSEFDNEYRPDLQLYHETGQGNSLILIIFRGGYIFCCFVTESSDFLFRFPFLYPETVGCNWN